MLTLFTVPKAFRNHIGVIQSNAIQSWVRLSPSCDVILFGDEEGIAEAASRCKVQHVPEVFRNQYGTPLLNDLFEKAYTKATHNIMCYVNADIILTSDLIRAVERIRQGEKPFLLVGRRWDIDFEKALNFEQTNWEAQLRVYVRRRTAPTTCAGSRCPGAGSAAARAGLRDGDELVGWELPDETDTKVQLQIRRSGQSRTISYYPRGARSRVLQFAVERTPSH